NLYRYRIVVSKLGSRANSATLHRTIGLPCKPPLVYARFHHPGASLVSVIDDAACAIDLDLEKG
ncbi:hypothetical protein PMAYCL1PPCAC_20430, partial [Pristionchus mayeri]